MSKQDDFDYDFDPDRMVRRWRSIYSWVALASFIAVGHPIIIMFVIAQTWLTGVFRDGYWGILYITKIDPEAMYALESLTLAWAIAGVVLTVFILVAALAKRRGIEL